MNYIKPALVLTLGGIGSLMGYGILYGNEKLYSSYIMPTIQKFMDGEEAHNLAIILAKYKLVPFSKRFDNEEILVIIISDNCFSFIKMV